MFRNSYHLFSHNLLSIDGLECIERFEQVNKNRLQYLIYFHTLYKSTDGQGCVERFEQLYELSPWTERCRQRCETDYRDKSGAGHNTGIL